MHHRRSTEQLRDTDLPTATSRRHGTTVPLSSRHSLLFPVSLDIHTSCTHRLAAHIYKRIHRLIAPRAHKAILMPRLVHRVDIRSSQRQLALGASLNIGRVLTAVGLPFVTLPALCQRATTFGAHETLRMPKPTEGIQGTRLR